MLDIKYIRENLEEVKKNLKKRGAKIDLEKLLKFDDEKKDLLKKIETLRFEQKKLTGKNDRAVEIKQMLKDLEPQLYKVGENFKVEAVKMPNLLQADVPAGKDENDNQVIKEMGEIKLRKGKDHVEIGKALDLIEIERAVKVSGNRFYYLKNQAVELEFALVRYVLDLVKAEGFQPIIPPVLIKEEMAWGSGHFEAINDDAYHLKNDPLVAIGTSEQSILPYFAGEIIENLPQRFVGFSTCLRREAGSYGKDVKGILRAHQFDKLEMFTFCRGEDSKKEHELIIDLEEKIVSGLALPYRIISVCAGDLGLPSAKTIDLETWMPGESRFRETHSSSNCTDFQSRRLKIRYKEKDKVDFVHTLNGTAVAIGRILIAILENYQQEDGSVKVPEVLQKYCGFEEIKK
ncbi:MAG: serine--tRNA ligase [Patescibacteria group bacterium]|nr:serine--tRNA ligase [Patescibacteria group bacterium]